MMVDTSTIGASGTKWSTMSLFTVIVFVVWPISNLAICSLTNSGGI
ncbi:hypothetical protein LINGRAHAP2_LOCUS23770 [Linum grandiflorum]